MLLYIAAVIDAVIVAVIAAVYIINIWFTIILWMVKKTTKKYTCPYCSQISRRKYGISISIGCNLLGGTQLRQKSFSSCHIEHDIMDILFY